MLYGLGLACVQQQQAAERGAWPNGGHMVLGLRGLVILKKVAWSSTTHGALNMRAEVALTIMIPVQHALS